LAEWISLGGIIGRLLTAYRDFSLTNPALFLLFWIFPSTGLAIGFSLILGFSFGELGGW